MLRELEVLTRERDTVNSGDHFRHVYLRAVIVQKRKVVIDSCEMTVEMTKKLSRQSVRTVVLSCRRHDKEKYQERDDTTWIK